MARVGGHRGRSSGHTFSHDGSARDVRLTGRGVKTSSGSGEVSQRILGAMDQYYAALARGDKGAAERIKADMAATKPGSGKAANGVPKVAEAVKHPGTKIQPRPDETAAPTKQQYSDAERRWIDARRADGSTASDADLLKQRQQRIDQRADRSRAGGDVKAQSARRSEAHREQNKVTPKRQAAMDAYKQATGRDAPKSMTIRAMNARAAEHIGTTSLPSGPQPIPANRSIVPSNVPPAPPRGPSLGNRAMNAYTRAQPALAAYGAGVQAFHAYRTARSHGADRQAAMHSAAKEAAVPLAFAAAGQAGRIEKAASWYSKNALSAAAGAWSDIGSTTDMLTYGRMSTGPAVFFSTTGHAARGLAAAAKVAKVAGRIALPAVVGYSAFKGAQEDTENRVRGAMRGVVRGLDPTSMFMATGLGERLFDRAFGSAPMPSLWQQYQAGKQYRSGSAASMPGMGQQPRLTGPQQQMFAGANAGYQTAPASTTEPKGKKKGGRGFANAQVQMAAQEARGVANFTHWAQSGDNYPGGA